MTDFNNKRLQIFCEICPLNNKKKSTKIHIKNIDKIYIKNLKLYKTILCRSWVNSGTCSYGKKCQFAHGLQDLHMKN
mgnify:CR=1 FL=1